MNYLHTGRCRLCADTKTPDQFVNLQTDEAVRRDTMQKLSRLSLEVLSSTSEQTVCFSCIDSLDKAFEFVSRVEAAQVKLSQITSSVKLEIVDHDLDETNELKYDLSTTVKIEIEPIITKEMLRISNDFEPPSNKKIDSCNDIPAQTALSWKDYVWRCSYCESSFPNVEDLKSHSIDVHECCNAYSCMDCKARSHNLDSFLLHVKSHKTYLKLSCYKCYKIFSKSTDANAHKKVHVNSKFKCSGCNDTFPNAEELARHSDAFNKYFRNPVIPSLLRLTNKLSCVQCNKKFSDETHLKRHLLLHTERKRVYTCDKCGKCFLNKQDLKSHLNTHQDIKPYKCQVCDNCFRRRSHLLEHAVTHNKLKPICCKQCGKQFRCERNLRAHSVIHISTLPFVCSYCNKGFRRKQTMITHIRQHTGEKPYSCEHCQRAFTNWPNYNKHVKGQHGLPKKTAKVKKQCLNLNDVSRKLSTPLAAL